MARTLELTLSDDVHDALARRAAREGLSVEDLVRRELEAAHPYSLGETLDRIHKRTPMQLPVAIADLIREGREERGALPSRW